MTLFFVLKINIQWKNKELRRANGVNEVGS